MKTLFIAILFFPAFLMAQQTPNINLVFGTYIDDQVEHTYTSNERIWNLDNGTLDYSIDANDSRWVDTLILTKAEMRKITQLMQKHEPLKSVNKEFVSNAVDMHEVKKETRASVTFNGTVVDIFIKSYGYDLPEEASGYEWLQDLELLFFEILEAHG